MTFDPFDAFDAFGEEDAPFDPLTLSPALWLSDTGSDVAIWPDLSGNDRNATQSTPNNRPAIISSGLNGRQVRRWDGTNDQLATASWSVPVSYSLVIVAKANSWTVPGGYRSLISHAYISTGNTLKGLVLSCVGGPLEDWLAGDILVAGSGYPLTRTPRAVGPAAAGNDFRVVSVVLSSTEARIWINGTRISTRVESTGSLASASGPFVVGQSGSGMSEFWAGDIAEVLALPYGATTIQRQYAERGFGAKYGISVA